MGGRVEEIFVTGEGSAAMESVAEVETVEGCGIRGDRYCEGTGFWTRYGDVCQVTLIQGEHLDEIESLGLEIRRSEEHTSDLQSRQYLVCRLLLEKKYSTSNSYRNSTLLTSS